MLGELIFPLISVISYRANKDVDASFFSIIKNLTPIITIATAWFLLNEGLSTLQIIGASIIIVSTFIVSLPSINKRHGSNKINGILLALLSVILLGVAVTYERWMLTQMSFSAYLVYGWGAQTLWMTLIAWPERKNIVILKDSKLRGNVLMYGLTKALRGLCWVSALSLSSSASLVSASGSFITILVVISAYFTLKEKQNLKIKLLAASVGAVGLIILNL